MRKILNLTQHQATPEQIAAGVFECAHKADIQKLLTFDNLPEFGQIQQSAAELAEIAAYYNAQYAMIGGAPFLMSQLEFELNKLDITPIYAFSRRESVEETGQDGTVIKKSVFKHVGFVEV